MDELQEAVLAVLVGIPGSGPLRPPTRTDPDAGPCNAPNCWTLHRRYGELGQTHCPAHHSVPRIRWTFAPMGTAADPVLAARPCPHGLLPANARRMLARAADLGWDARASYAIGHRIDAHGVPTKLVRSVLVQASHEQRRLWASWSGIMGAKTLGFESAWRWPGPDGWPESLCAAELKGEW